MRTVSGLIVSRRCVGQSLSFVTVKESGTSAAWTLTFKPEPFDARLSGTVFPKRKSDLRCGDEIVAHVVDQDGESCVVAWSSAGLGGGRPEGRLDREGQASLALTDEERAIGLCGEWALLGECTGNSCPVRRPPTIRSVRKVTLDLPLVRLQHTYKYRCIQNNKQNNNLGATPFRQSIRPRPMPGGTSFCLRSCGSTLVGRR